MLRFVRVGKIVLEEKKAKLTLDFIRIKTQEYDRLKQEIEDLKQEAKNMDRGLL